MRTMSVIVLVLCMAMVIQRSEALRCKGIDTGCCTKAKPCGLGDGDCDNDKECAGSLKCGKDNCPWDNKDDCCYTDTKLVNFRCTGGYGNRGCCTKGKPCAEGEGDCDNDKECGKGLKCGVNNCPWGHKDDCCYSQKSLRCKGIDTGCCTKAKPCGLGDGDCDNDKECAGSLKCGKDNCPWDDKDDCCYTLSSLRCKGIDDGCCTKAKPCGLGDGDCDKDEDCAGDLKCGRVNCPWGDKDDCCFTLKKEVQQRCHGQDDGCCTKATPCVLGEGDCDTNAQCAGSLICGSWNCPWGDKDDCCTHPKKVIASTSDENKEAPEEVAEEVAVPEQLDDDDIESFGITNDDDDEDEVNDDAREVMDEMDDTDDDEDEDEDEDKK